MIRKMLLGGMLAAMAVPAWAASAVNLNEASAQKLAKALEGVGEVRAQSIVDYRESNGDFASVNALVEVDGIGEATLNKNKDRLTVGGQ